MVFGQALNAVSRAGGDVQAFADDFGTRLQSGVTDAQSAFGNALNAANRAGADVQAFASTFAPRDPVAPAPAAVPSGGYSPPAVAGGPLQDYARQAAARAGIDPDLFVRQIQQESGFNPSARSPAGATGVAQIVPRYHPGVDPTDPYASLDYAANLMRTHLNTYGGDYSKALAAYNGGGGAVGALEHGQPYQETQSYLRNILGGAQQKVGELLGGGPQFDSTGHTFPLVGYKVGSNGNNAPSATYHGAGGSDLMAPRGTPILSMIGGTVTGIYTEDPSRPGQGSPGGNAVQIHGDDGLDYYYAHMDGLPLVREGQRVGPGAQIGAVGNSGNAYKGGQGETHLHLGIGHGISSGVGAEGGLGQNFDAKSFLTGLLPFSGNAPPQSPQVSPHSTMMGPLQDAASSAQQRIESLLSEWEGASQAFQERGRAFVDEQTRNLGSGLESVFGPPGVATDPYSGASALGHLPPGATSVPDIRETPAGRTILGTLEELQRAQTEHANLPPVQRFLEDLSSPLGQWSPQVGPAVVAGLERGGLPGYQDVLGTDVLGIPTGPLAGMPLGTEIQTPLGPLKIGPREIAGALAEAALPGGAEFGGPTRGALREVGAEAMEALQREGPELLMRAEQLARTRLPAEAEVGFAMGLPRRPERAVEGALEGAAAAAPEAPGAPVATPRGLIYDSAADAARASSEMGAEGIHLERKPEGGFGWAPGVTGERLTPASSITDDAVRTAAEDFDKILTQRRAVSRGEIPSDPTPDEAKKLLGTFSANWFRERLTDRRASLATIEKFIERKQGFPVSPEQSAWMRARLYEGRQDAALARLEEDVSPAWRAVSREDRAYLDAYMEQMDNVDKGRAIARRVEGEQLARPIRQVAGTAAAEEAQKAADRAESQLARLQKMEAEGNAPGAGAVRRAEERSARMQRQLDELNTRTAQRQAGGIERQVMEEIMREPLRLDLRDANIRYSKARRAFADALEAEDPKKLRPALRELDRAEWQQLQAQDAARTAGDVRAERLGAKAAAEIGDIAERGPRETPAIARAQRDLDYAERDLARAQRNVEKRGSAAQKTVVDRAQAKLARAKDRLEEATRAAEAAHVERAQERGAAAGYERKFSGGARMQDEEQVREALRQRVGDARFKTIDDAAQAAWRTMNKMRDRLVESGVWSQEEADFFRDNFPHYIRTHILEATSDDALGALPHGGRSFSVGSDGVKKLTVPGTEKARQSPMSSLVDMAFHTEDVARRNDIMRTMADWADNDFMAPFIRKLGADEEVPRGFVAKPYMDGDNGKQRLAVVKGLENSMNLSKPAAGILGTILRGMGMPLRAGATALRPGFIAYNAFNDAFWSLFRHAAEAPNPVEGVRAITDLAKGYGAAAGLDQELIQRARLAGASISPRARSMNPEDLVRQLSGDRVWVRTIRNDGDRLNLLKDRLGQASDVAGLLWSRPLQHIGGPIEEAPRLGAFARAERAGLTPEEAAMAYRTHTADFAAGGTFTKALNDMIPFLNPATQASAEFGGLARRRPLQTGAGIGAIAAATILSEIHNRSIDQEDWRDTSRYLRDHGIGLLSDQAPQGEGKRGLAYFPVRGAPGAIIPLVREAMGRMYGDDPRTWQSLAKEVFGSLSPVEPEMGGLGSFVPPIPKLAFELASNYDMFRGAPIVPTALQSLPPTEQYTDRTSQTARALARSDIPGFSGQSPAKIDYLIRSFSPGPAEATLGLGDHLIEMAGRALPERPAKGEPGARDIPVAGNILGRFLRTSGEEQRTEAYDRASRLMDDKRRAVLDNVQNSPTYQRSTPDEQQRMLRSLEGELDKQALDVAGVEPKARDLGLPNKYIGVTDPKKEQQIDDALSIYRAWNADPRSTKPTKEELKLALMYEDMVNPKYTFASRKQESELAAVRRQVGQAVSGH